METLNLIIDGIKIEVPTRYNYTRGSKISWS